ncbi:ExeA family protein [Rhizobacter sp. Root1221]|uniref:ExeA family protein n=1 Tax=Rhizobacter sp. Root1221 TaxID=1736433 RepID=UPI0006F94157|nr:ExeA family protein [Rhizobacter sp. Root1221]KQV85932.1 peptidoglycan-binding protein [Rhizobacter sp. Root1221]
MYAKFFGLKQQPFSIAPDPRYLFMSERHREALAHLRYGATAGGGFVLLTGEIGAGKTTVCRCFLEHLPRRCNVAYVFNPQLTVLELLKTICGEFHVPVAHPDPAHATVKDFIDPLNEFLLRTHAIGLSNILIVDEAQMLAAEVLEQLRLLTNLETNERKLLQIILIGQPELREMLARPELEQLAQRVTARFHLPALSEADTAKYIRHRLAVAGQAELRPFDRRVRRRIHQLTRGVPRRINLLCDRALLGAYTEGKRTVDLATVERAAEEVFYKNEPEPPPLPAPRRGLLLGAGVLGGALLFGAATWLWSGRAAAPRPAPVVHAVAAAPPVPASAPAPARAPSAAAVKTGIGSPTRVEDDAWRALGAAWKADLAGNDACAAARQHELQCFRRSADLTVIRQLDRPGIVTLHDESDKPAYALLTGLGERHAVLRMGDVSQRISLVSLAKIWRGEYATLWRVPPGFTNRVDKGQKGALVDWLATGLAKAGGEAPPASPSVFDNRLQARVAAFQLAQGLKPDGLPGPTTLMQLNRVAGVDEPKLSSEPVAP